MKLSTNQVLSIIAIFFLVSLILVITDLDTTIINSLKLFGIL